MASFLLLPALLATSVLASGHVPLVHRQVASPAPQQVNPYPVERGPQVCKGRFASSGYNICNSGTAGPDSQCQTLIVNSIDDFCLWGSPTTDQNATIGDIEAAVVAYCTKDTHGARTIPGGSLTGVQFMRTSKYIQITGHIDQRALNLQADDTGGELDPHGADLMGNPLGGLVYSTAFPGGNNVTEIQAIEWTNFLGSGTFCIKLCFDETGTPNYCENRYDLIGCNYNMPASYKDLEFTSCEGELQDVVGVYSVDGKTSTYTQPQPGPLTAPPPYTPRIPASSNCVTYQSTALYSAASTTMTGAAASTATNSAGAAPTSGSAAAAGVSRAGASSAAASTPTGAATSLKAGGGVLAVAAVVIVVGVNV